MTNRIADIEEFLEIQFSGACVLDVRTPAEFNEGHIPLAVNLPLFSNDERKIIGTTYKQVSREKAILQALKFVGPELYNLAIKAMAFAGKKQILIHCWRGGMRSSSVAWLLNMLGRETITLKRGYKAFRNYALKTFSFPYQFRILGGKTGSSKTLLLRELQKKGEQIIDLEGLAFHKGSAFGGIGQDAHTTQEQFENDLAHALGSMNREKIIWLEDESRHVGRLVIPQFIWEKMRASPVVFLDIPQPVRVEYLKEQYGLQKEIAPLKNAFMDIKKRLGDVRYNDAVSALQNGDFGLACKIALDYYDRAYEFGLSKRNPDSIHKIHFETLDEKQIVEKLVREFA